jgi:nitrogen fixation NifU-like protein
LSYSATFKDHLLHPRHAGKLENADFGADETNPVCGDRIILSLRVEADRIADVRFLAYGCPPTLVCGSILTDLVLGKSVAEAICITRNDLIAAVGGLPSRKHHAAALAIETLRSALATRTTEAC